MSGLVSANLNDLLDNCEDPERMLRQSEAESEALLELLGVDEFADPFDANVEAELRAMREAASHVTH